MNKEEIIKHLSAYSMKENEKLTDINAEGYLFKHKKSGARVIFLEANDNNKTFMIGFRTPPSDDTGVAHIMEHSVLCGSKKFPVKDPFIELVKGSLNTFLNAMTFPDKTIYPVASTNDKDFRNLMDVYLDAVFYPNVYEHEEIFRQEGITLNLEEADGELTYNGVVYNEMKGAFSSPDDVLERAVTQSLFPDTCYGVESGGDPDHIPELTYEQFLDFHKKYYHPSNSYIYLYGDMDMETTLNWLDEEYLSKFDEIELDSEIKLQQPFTEMREVHEYYPISENEKEEDNTYLSYNYVVGDILDAEKYLAFQILEYAVASMPGSPVKKALLDAGVGKDVSGRYNNYILQPYFTISARNANPQDKDRFVKIIEEVIEDLVKNGIDKNSLLAAINNYEFQYRENDFGSYPKGLMFSFQIMDSWLYSEENPFRNLKQNEIFDKLRRAIDTDYFEKLLEEYFINNNHRSLVVIEPRSGLTTKKDNELKDKLAKIKKSMTKEELEELVENTIALRKYKEEPSSQEDLKKIPLLKLEEISKDIEPIYNTPREIQGVKTIQHDIFTNGIGYLGLYFDVSDVAFEKLPYLMLLKGVFAYMDTSKYTYSEICNEIGIHTGGIYADVNIYADANIREKYSMKFEIKSKVFFDKIDKAFELIQEMINETKYDDYKRLYEIICEGKTNLQASLMRSGDSAALLRNMSYLSGVSAVNEKIKGISYYKFIEKLESDFENIKEEIVENLIEMAKHVFRRENLVIGYTANDQGYNLMQKSAAILLDKLGDSVPNTKNKDDEEDVVVGKQKPDEVVKKNEGFKNSSQVQYVTMAGRFDDKGYEYTGTLAVLKTILSYEYLWKKIRMDGGAYGCSSIFSKSGVVAFTSYRDPKLSESLKVFEGGPDYVAEFDEDDRDMVKYIIGTISGMDTPLTALSKGNRSMTFLFTNEKMERLQKNRLEVLETTQEKIRQQAELIREALKDQSICVVGNEGKIAKEKEVFKETYNLFS